MSFGDTMKRRNFLKALGIAAVSSQAVKAEPKQITAKRINEDPNLMGFEMAQVKAEGQSIITTGNIPRLMQEGVKKAFDKSMSQHADKWPDIFK